MPTKTWMDRAGFPEMARDETVEALPWKQAVTAALNTFVELPLWLQFAELAELLETGDLTRVKYHLQWAARHYHDKSHPKVAKRDRDDSATLDMLLLAGVFPEGQLLPTEKVLGVIAEWGDYDSERADEWALLTHLHASDNDVIVPARPKCVDLLVNALLPVPRDTEESRE